SRSDRAALGSSEDRPTAKSSLQSGPKRSPIESGDTVRIKFSFPRNSLAPPTCDSPALEGRATACGQKFVKSERKRLSCSTFDSALFTLRFYRRLHFRETSDCPALEGQVDGPALAGCRFATGSP